MSRLQNSTRSYPSQSLTTNALSGSMAASRSGVIRRMVCTRGVAFTTAICRVAARAQRSGSTAVTGVRG